MMNKSFPKRNEKPIAFIDSGIGGLPYLKWCKNELPNENFLYFADREHFPYGEKSVSSVKSFIIKSAERITEAFSPKIIVVACNTASVIALEDLRRRFSLPIIGVVPAVKPAAFLSKKRKIGVLGSSRTVENVYTERLIRDFASDCTVSAISGHEIIDFVENRYFEADNKEKIQAVQPTVDYCYRKDIDVLVLGCTHFIFLNEEFQKTCRGNIQVIDSREGVGRQIVRVLERGSLHSTEKGEDLFFHSGSNSFPLLYRRYAEMFGLTYAGRMTV